MSEPAARLSVSVPSALASAVRRRVGNRGLSGFVARAIAHELEREQLGELLGELDRAFGPASREHLRKVRREWPRR